MLSCSALERSNNPYIESIMEPGVSKNQREIFSMWVIGKKILKMCCGNEKNCSWAESGICVFLYVREKTNNSFQITVIIFKAYKKHEFPIQNGFYKCRSSNHLHLTLEPVLTIAKETKKEYVQNICARVTRHASKEVAKAEINLNWLWKIDYGLFWLNIYIHRWYQCSHWFHDFSFTCSTWRA